MKKIVFMSVLAAFFIIAAACTNSSTGTKDPQEQIKSTTEVYYTCTMHPEVHSDKPGGCPKCGMPLVKKETIRNDSTQVPSQTGSMKMD